MFLHILAQILTKCPEKILDLLGNAVSVAYAYQEQKRRHQRVSDHQRVNDQERIQAWLN